MSSSGRLDWLLRDAARRAPDADAVRFNGSTVSYRELDELADNFAVRLDALGVCPQDRVGVWLDKSPNAIAAMQATLRLGAAYVPVDPQSPGVRAAAILDDCSVAAIVTTKELATLLRSRAANATAVMLIDEERALDQRKLDEQPPKRSSAGSEDDPAYILYTSGSTGKPKGVEISHRNALAFVLWVVNFIDAKATDRFSNHAPFHFDLSVLDIYASFSSGACVCIIPSSLSFAPRRLLQFIIDEELTIWYSVPSALIMMVEHAELLKQSSLPIRHLIFAGEPFPIASLRALRARWPSLPMHNFYGPTETNVCTAFTVDSIDEQRTRPVPIGRATCGNRVWALTQENNEAQVGEEGELFVAGPTVMLGYYGHPPQGERAYPTGDIVRRIDELNYEFIGRRDQMLKVRGHRIEAGEVESCLLQHDQVREAAVVVLGSGIAARLLACLVGAGDKNPGIIALKQHCAERLPRSMIIDKVRWLDELPRTTSGKVDRRALASDSAQ